MSGHWTGAKLRWVLVIDLNDDTLLLFNREVPEAATVSSYGITKDGKYLMQMNSNGQMYFVNLTSGEITLRGFDIDQELIVYDERGYYTSTPEGAHFIFLKFPGLPGYNSLHQFASKLNRPDIIAGILAGAGKSDDPRLRPPPALQFEGTETSSGSRRTINTRYSAYSSDRLKLLRVFVDGQPVKELALNGNQAEGTIAVELPSNARWVTGVAIDNSSIESVPQPLNLEMTKAAPAGRLFVITVGTDIYDDKDWIPQLTTAKIDAVAFEMAVKQAAGKYYAAVTVAPFLDAGGLSKSLPSKVREVVATATESDTIMLFVAGHGYQEKDPPRRFYLATRDTTLFGLKNALSWDDLAGAFQGAKARVIVFLDACHSGATGDNGTNDDAVSSLLTSKASLTVVAAAKGRQDSLGLKKRYGYFTNGLVEAISRSRAATDSNHNGVIELAELYAVLKKQVVETTNGKQTPWIARNHMVGEIPLF